MAPHTCRSQAAGRPPLVHIQGMYDENMPLVSQTRRGSTKGPLHAVHQNGTNSIQPSASQLSELDYFSKTYLLRSVKP